MTIKAVIEPKGQSWPNVFFLIYQLAQYLLHTILDLAEEECMVSGSRRAYIECLLCALDSATFFQAAEWIEVHSNLSVKGKASREGGT